MKTNTFTRVIAMIVAFIITALTVVGCGDNNKHADAGDTTTVDASTVSGTDATSKENNGTTDADTGTDNATDKATEPADITTDDTTAEPDATTEPADTTNPADTTTETPDTTKTPETTKSPEPVGHKHSYKKSTVKPTCTERGYTTYTCKDCGYSYTEYTNATGHKWHDYTYDKELGPEIRALMSGTIPPGEEYDRLQALWEAIIPGVRCEYCDIYRCEVEGHHGSPPSCNSDSLCDDCLKVTISKALGHDFVRGVCSRCGLADWKSEELLADIADRVIYYINQFRAEDGVNTLEKTEGLTEIAQYRSVQLIDNYAHDKADIEEAYDNTTYGDAYRHLSAEAICRSTGAYKDIDTLAHLIASAFRNSEGHWAYLGDSFYNFIGVGISSVGKSPWKTIYCCVTVNDCNFG